MGRGDQHAQRRFTVPVRSGDGPAELAWPFLEKTKSDGCGHAARRTYTYNARTKTWMCESCAQTAAAGR